MVSCVLGAGAGEESGVQVESADVGVHGLVLQPALLRCVLRVAVGARCVCVYTCLYTLCV